MLAGAWREQAAEASHHFHVAPAGILEGLRASLAYAPCRASSRPRKARAAFLSATRVFSRLPPRMGCMPSAFRPLPLWVDIFLLAETRRPAGRISGPSERQRAYRLHFEAFLPPPVNNCEQDSLGISVQRACRGCSA